MAARRVIFLVAFQWIVIQTSHTKEMDIKHRDMDDLLNELVVTAHRDSRLFLPLNSTNVLQKSQRVRGKTACVFACLREPWCHSMNLKITPEKDGRHVCEVMSSDKYNNSKHLISDKEFTHLSIKSPCEDNPCGNNGTCIALYNKQDYYCACGAGFTGHRCMTAIRFHTMGNSGLTGPIQQFPVPKSGRYIILAGGARGGTHTYNYEWKPGTYLGGKGATMQGTFRLTTGTTLNIVVGQRGGNSVEVKGGRSTTQTAAQLGISVEDNAGTGGGGGSFVYTVSNTLLLAAGGGGGASGGYNGIDGQSEQSGTGSRGKESGHSRSGGTAGNPGQCNSVGGNWHGGVGAGWNGQGCTRLGPQHGERGGSRSQGWIGGRAGGMNSGLNGGPAPGAVGGFGGGGGGSQDNGASGGGGGYSGGGSGTHPQQAGGGGGSYCSGTGCSGVTGGNSNDTGFVEIRYLGN